MADFSPKEAMDDSSNRAATIRIWPAPEIHTRSKCHQL
jgi:hypothetical protein